MSDNPFVINQDTDNWFVWPIRVYYEDTDAGGIVYHSHYLNYFERARTEWLRSLGYELDALADSGVMFVITRAEVDYITPAKFNQELEVQSTVIQYRGASFTFAQQILCGPTSVARATVKAASVNTVTQRPVKMPPNLKKEIGFVS